MKSNSSDKSLEYLKYENLSHRREKHVLALVKRVLMNICPQFFINYFNLNKDCIERTTTVLDRATTLDYRELN